MKQNSLLAKTIIQITAGLTLLLVLLGYIGYSNTKSGLEEALQADAQNAIDRLSSSLPISVWNFDAGIAAKAIEAEVQADFINSIAVISNGEPFVARSKAQDGSISEKKDSPHISAFDLKKALEFEEDGTINQVG